MLYIWSAVVAILAAVIWYCRLPLVVFPALLFVTFLASGGRNFPKVFFGTILRDLRYVQNIIPYINKPYMLACSKYNDPCMCKSLP